MRGTSSTGLSCADVERSVVASGIGSMRLSECCVEPTQCLVNAILREKPEGSGRGGVGGVEVEGEEGFILSETDRQTGGQTDKQCCIFILYAIMRE